MRPVRRFVVRLLGSFGGGRREQELTEELESNLQLHIDDNIRAGMTPNEARRQAILAFGGVEQTKEWMRDQQSSWLETCARDLRYAARTLLKNRVFTATAVFTLALGIGATAATFSLIQAVVLRPLPYYEPAKLVFAWLEHEGRPVSHATHGILTGTHVREWQRRATSLESLAVISSWATNPSSKLDLITVDGAERLRGAFVTPNFFELLGVEAAVGRTFGSEDGEAAPDVVVISHSLWHHRFGADPGVIGQEIDLLRGRSDRQRFTVIGVLPRAFRFTYPLETQVWGMLPWTVIVPSRALDYQVVARLNTAATASTAQGELTTITQELAIRSGAPADASRQQFVLVERLGDHLAAEVKDGLHLLFAAAGVVMLIACVNAALLIIAFMIDRRREMALRAALGAAPAQLVRQSLIEISVLGACGGIAGLLLAWWIVPLLRAVAPAAVPRADEIALDGAVVTFSLMVTVAAAALAALVALWTTRRRGPQEGLRVSSAWATDDRGVLFWRRAILAIQAATVLIMLVGAGLLLHSFWRMQRVDLGFAEEELITMEMRLLNPKYRQPGRIAEFQAQVLDRVRALPGVQQASMTTAVPFRGVDFTFVVRPVGGSVSRVAKMRSVDPEYFTLMGIPLLAGRTFTAGDDERARRVAVISEAYSRSLFGDASPLGKELDLREGPTEVIGVVGDVRYANVTTAPAPALYLPRAQQPNELICLLVRPAPGAAAVAAAVAATVQAVDPEQPVENVTTLDQIVRESTAEERFYTVVVAAFALTAVLLAMAGLMGVVSRIVTERERELAVRMALGADPKSVGRLAVRQGLVPVVIGVIAGAFGAWSVSRLLERFLFEISPLDPVAYLGAVAVVLLAAVAACYIPARRATGVDPMIALRAE